MARADGVHRRGGARGRAACPPRPSSRALRGGLDGAGGVRGAGAGRLGDLVADRADGLDRAHLALAAGGDVADGGGDLADRAAGLVGGGGEVRWTRR